MKCSLFKSAYATKPTRQADLTKLMGEIREGMWQKPVETARAHYQNGNKPAYKALKNKLPAFYVSGYCRTRRSGATEAERDFQHNGLLQVDIDEKDNGMLSLGRMRQIAIGCPFAVAVFVSVSGAGLKVLVRCEPDRGIHFQSFLAAEKWFKENGITIDRATKSPFNLCFVSFDPDLNENKNAVAIPPLLSPAKENLLHPKSAPPPGRVEELLKTIADTDPVPDYDDWISIIYATVDGVGAERAIELLMEIFPEKDPNEYKKRAKTFDSSRTTWHRLESFARDELSVFENLDAVPDPRPLPSELAPVLSLTPDMLPEALRLFVVDIAERISCPLEFPAVSIIIAAGSVLGRTCGIHPKGRDDWYELANLWGLLIARPSMMKSPAMAEALHPLRTLEVAAKTAYEDAKLLNEENALLAKLKYDVAVKKARSAISKGDKPESALLPKEPAEPTLRRYIATDTSSESLVELCRQNPNGVLLLADEMSGLLALLDRPGNEALRSLYLTGWAGKQGYMVDRVGRGMGIGAESVCLSLLGTIQPDPLRHRLFNSDNGSPDDGLTQRFQLAVWPDDNGKWKFVDRPPDSQARAAALKAFQRLDQLWPDLEIDGIEPGDSKKHRPPCVRFTDDACEAFARWSEENHTAGRRAGETCLALESVFGKYPKLVSGLSLLFHLIDGGGGPVDLESLHRAIQWAKVLATHARRIFEAGEAFAAQTARRILSKIKDGLLRAPFTARNIYRRNWSGLKDPRNVDAALALLEEYGWLLMSVEDNGGRPKEIYMPHPKITEKQEGGSDKSDRRQD
ncbi:MAG TPA: DUF3987 domain-containing protein [Verrucomicrobiales bacterium]|nr:DUF3987 domain-containing protein [Verrucomicrobiales bacterium]